MRRGQWLAFKGFQEEGLVYDTSEVSQSVRTREKSSPGKQVGESYKGGNLINSGWYHSGSDKGRTEWLH